MCGGTVGDMFSGIKDVPGVAAGGIGDMAKMTLPKPLGTGEVENNTQKGVKDMLPGLSIMALPFAAAGGAALAGGAAGGAEAGGGAAAGGSLFGPGAADALDASLIGPGAGAAAGSGSAFASNAAAVGAGAGADESVLFPGESATSGDAATGTSMVGPDGMQTLSPETAQMLGVNPAGDFTGNVGDYTGGMSLSPGSTSASVETVPDSAPMDAPTSGGSGGSGYFDQVSELLKKIGLSPASAGLLGLSAAQALSKPKQGQAAKTQQNSATQNTQAASAVLQSGGTSSPAWAGQKSSIDTTIDEQIRQQVAAMMQQAQNSGQGADSQVTQQQINKIKNQLETQRQTLYAQAQQQNVAAALQQLGISNQALSSVAGQQFNASNLAKTSAAETAKIALQLQALQNKSSGGGSASVVNQGNRDSA